MTSNSPDREQPPASGSGSSSLPGARPPATRGGTPPESAARPGKAGAPAGSRSGEAAASPRGTKDKGRKKPASGSGGDWNVFRTVVVLVGIVIAGFGAYYLFLGTAGLPETEGGPVNPTLESQFRFFAAVMVGVGAAFITIAVKFQWANMLWLVCLMVFIGGIGRVLSWAFSGTPNAIMIILMIVELAFPPALLVWHKYIAKTSELREAYGQRD